MTRTQLSGGTGPSRITHSRNGLLTECRFNPRGRIERTIEHYAGDTDEYRYEYDNAGHLLTVRRNGSTVEQYEYNAKGQRCSQTRRYRSASDRTEGRLAYDGNGRLIEAGDTAFYYDRHGALSERCDYGGTTTYAYNGDTMPDKIVLPSNLRLSYEYDPEQCFSPILRFRNSTLTADMAWDGLLLRVYRDYDTKLRYDFTYTEAGVLHAVRLSFFKPDENGPYGRRHEDSGDWLQWSAAENRRERLLHWLKDSSMPLTLYCGCDQVGTLKTLTDKYGDLVKAMAWDSFGVRYEDTFPDLFMPVGFAGGLTDRDTGLVRFGYRDYDPTVGRFTAPDPLGDTGGDHDLYDYCIDDPVTMNDPSGLLPPAIAAGLGIAGALGLGLGGSYGAAAVADTVGGYRKGEKSTAARDGIKAIASKTAEIHLNSFFPGQLVLGKVTAGATRVLATKIGLEFLKRARSDSRRSDK